ncbi:MAG: tyrosine--tRNA ligase [Spirochaetes bacterium GWD1_27_9]|nr:MAG: tyrosine--tRNA ligase [Spirochaetes bacterium GWB1_27_13]OHD38144.1 MAG: tyrosine--tRNA ligase [Spirochaetes bacterium GWD1_27_9]
MKDCLNILKQRGFFQQCTDEANLAKLLDEKEIIFYAGFDPTNVSLHLGHLVPIMAMAFLQRMGHKPIALVGGGTAMIGDPSGKTEARKMLTVEDIDSNVLKIKEQLEKFLILDDKKGFLLNNADWLRNINYLNFLRDIGKHFSVNRMLSFETYKEKMKHGLSFLEFNYILLQSYDFLELFKRNNCILQVGGDDQWANMVSGVELIRRVAQSTEVECLTFPLILTSDGKKMGKTEKGAVFLSTDLTSPYDFYQYWINVTDDDTVRFLKLYTFLPLEEIKKYETLKGEELKSVKELLAFEVTKTVHGEEEAIKARDGAKAAFGGGDNIDFIPKTAISKDRLEAGIPVLDLFVECGLSESKGEVRRLIQQGGCKINEEKVDNEKIIINLSFLTDKGIILKSGKKKIHRIEII